MRKAALIAVLVLAAGMLPGCGYKLYEGPAEIKEITIGKILNKSREPQLENILYRQLADELQKQGFEISRNSPYEIYGELDIFNLVGDTEANGVFATYKVVISGKFYMHRPGKPDLVLKGQDPFIVEFATDPTMEKTFANRQVAVESAMQGLSSEMVSTIVYQ